MCLLFPIPRRVNPVYVKITQFTKISQLQKLQSTHNSMHLSTPFKQVMLQYLLLVPFVMSLTQDYSQQIDIHIKYTTQIKIPFPVITTFTTQIYLRINTSTTDTP